MGQAVGTEHAEAGRARYANVDGLRVRYVQTGAGSTVLLLHGMMGALSHWEPVVAPLAAHAAVVALDLPPFGASDKPPLVYSFAFYADFLTRFVRHLGLTDVTLVGHSFGGKVACYVAAMHPEWVTGLVLVASDGFLETPKHYRTFSYTPVMRLLCRLVPLLLPLAQRLVFPRGTVVPPAFTADARAFFAHPETPRALAAIARSERSLDLPTSDAAPRLRHLTIPVAIVQGEADGTMNPADARRAMAIFPHARLMLLPNVGHVVQIERPDAVIEAVRGVLSVVPAQRAPPDSMGVPTVRGTQEEGKP